MGTSSGSNIHRHSSSQMLPPRDQARPRGLQTSLSLVSSDAHLTLDGQDPRTNSDNHHESTTESASPRETWPTVDAVMGKKTENGKVADGFEHSIVRRFSGVDKVSLHDIAKERVDVITEKMDRLPNDYLEDLKNMLRMILEGNSGSQQREEFMIL